MTKAWRNLEGINTCAAGWYDAAGVALTPSQVTTAGLTATTVAGVTTLTSPDTNPIYYYRLTPNHGAGMGEAEARITVSGLTNVLAAAPRWDGGGSWANLSVATLAQPQTGDWTYIEIPVRPDNTTTASVSFTAQAYFDEIATASYNCTCGDEGGASYRTLLELRQILMRRLGFGNQIANPPPGLAEMLDSFLYEAQYNLWHRFTALRTVRYFSWPLLEGVRLYGFNNVAEGCSARLDPTKIRWVGVVQEGIYSPLVAGIRPELNTYQDITGRPTYYELRQCFEVWPVPDTTQGSLVVKGAFGLLPFAADNDVASVDDSLILSLALADAKAHYGQPDADRYIQRAEVLLQSLVAGTHTTRRYIPGQPEGDELIYVRPVASPPFAGP